MTPEQARMLTPLTSKHRDDWVGFNVTSTTFPVGISKMRVADVGRNIENPEGDFVFLKTLTGDVVAMVSADGLYIAPTGWLNGRPLRIGDRVVLNPRHRPMEHPSEYIGRVVGDAEPASSGPATAVRVCFPASSVIGNGNVVVCEIRELMWPEDVEQAPVAAPAPALVSGWINIYPNVTDVCDCSQQIAFTSRAVYPDVETADNHAGPTRVACVHVEFPAP